MFIMLIMPIMGIRVLSFLFRVDLHEILRVCCRFGKRNYLATIPGVLAQRFSIFLSGLPAVAGLTPSMVR